MVEAARRAEEGGEPSRDLSRRRSAEKLRAVACMNELGDPGPADDELRRVDAEEPTGSRAK